jgi:hypothetical protein
MQNSVFSSLLGVVFSVNHPFSASMERWSCKRRLHGESTLFKVIHIYTYRVYFQWNRDFAEVLNSELCMEVILYEGPSKEFRKRISVVFAVTCYWNFYHVLISCSLSLRHFHKYNRNIPAFLTFASRHSHFFVGIFWDPTGLFEEFRHFSTLVIK